MYNVFPEDTNMSNRTILIDLDGVLNLYTGNYDKEIIPSIKEGAEEFLKKLSKEYNIKLFTARNKILTFKWLKKNKIDKYFTDITNIKEPAWLYIDDRCIKFEGDYSLLEKQINTFKTWYKQDKKLQVK